MSIRPQFHFPPDPPNRDDREIIELEEESLVREKKIEDALHVPEGVHHHKRRVRSRRRKALLFPLRPTDAPFYA
jgi:hypothetical protein